MNEHHAYYAKPKFSIWRWLGFNPKRKLAFMNLMRDTVSDVLEASFGSRPTWSDPKVAPDHERSRNA